MTERLSKGGVRVEPVPTPVFEQDPRLDQDGNVPPDRVLLMQTGRRRELRLRPRRRLVPRRPSGVVAQERRQEPSLAGAADEPVREEVCLTHSDAFFRRGG
jgi:hypothetical protein